MVDFPTGFDKVVIANMALSNIGARSTISSFLENSAEASIINLWYEYCRLQTLQAFNWSFARKRLALTLSAEATDGVLWNYRYLIPDDCVSVRMLQNPLGPKADAVPYTIEQSPLGVKTLLTNLDSATAVYTTNVTDVDLFTPLFVDTLAACLGWRIAFTLTNSQAVATEQAQLFRALMMIAPAHDANEQIDMKPRDAEWIRGRH